MKNKKNKIKIENNKTKNKEKKFSTTSYCYSLNKKRMYQLAEVGYLTATDLADFMVRELKYPFRKAYTQTAKIINYAEKKQKKLSDLKIEEINLIEPKLKKDVLKVFDLKHSINSKTSYGGTSFENIKKMIKSYKKKYD